MGWLEKRGEFYFLFYFFGSFVTWWLNLDFFSRKYFIKIIIFFLGIENFHHKNLKIIFFWFKIEHLIHLTKKKKNQFWFCCMSKFFLCTW
jgi:hypothetical protein